MRVSAALVGLAAFTNSALAAIYYGASSSAAPVYNAVSSPPSYASQSWPTPTYGGSYYTPIQQIGDGQIQNPGSYGSPSPIPSFYSPPATFSNHTAIITTPKTLTSQVLHASTPVAPTVTASRPPVVQTGAANALVGSSFGLGFAALLAALIG